MQLLQEGHLLGIQGVGARNAKAHPDGVAGGARVHEAVVDEQVAVGPGAVVDEYLRQTCVRAREPSTA